MKTIFGPVPSRRLGRSLGIDVIPPKTCSYDCVYCESGLTTHLSIKRRPFVSPDEVMKELEAYFDEHPEGADALTFSSAGEPTLYEPLGQLIRDIKKRFRSIPLIVLTNGSLLWDPKVREDLMEADRVVPSLDAAGPEAFARLNRPHAGLDLPTIVEGLCAFGREYKGRLHMEVMLVEGFNDAPDELARIRRIIDRIAPHCVELNTVVRPPADPVVRGLVEEAMQEAQRAFPRDLTRIIGRFQAPGLCTAVSNLDERVLEMVLRRPCTLAEMSLSLSVPPEELKCSVSRLMGEGRLTSERFNDAEFFFTRLERA